MFLPYYFNPKGFYFSYDTTLLVKRFRSSLKFLATHWDQHNQPLLPFFVREDMLEDHQKKVIFELFYELQKGTCNSIPIRIGSLQSILNNANIERIENIDETALKNIELFTLDKEDVSRSSSNIIEHHYESVAQKQDWNNIRRFAEILGKYDDRLEDALLDIIIHQKRLAVGRAYSEKATFSKPLKNTAIVEIIQESYQHRR